MSIKTFNSRLLIAMLLGVCVACGTATRLSQSPDSTPYNVLFIAVDDLNDWVGFLGGHPQAKTPNLDRLAARSMVFEKAYCVVPACNPSRVALLTGMSPHKTGVYYNANDMWKSDRIKEKAITLPKYFSQHGYYTMAKGKLFHSAQGKRAEPDQWDIFHHPTGKSLGKHPDKTTNILASGMPIEGNKDKNFDWGVIEEVFLEESRDFKTAQFAAEELLKPHDKPFFMGCGIFRPHLPWYVPRGYMEQFPLEDIQLPPIKEDDLNDVPAIGQKMAQGLDPKSDYQRLQRFGKLKEAVRAYLASMKYADDCLGVILDALEKSPHKDNTIIVLWGDHGWHLGEKLHYRKFALWEEANRVPLLIHTPGMSTGQHCRRPVSLLDLYPTLTDLCQLPANPNTDGQSLAPLLKNPNRSWDRPAISTMGYKRHTVRDERYRYIQYEDGSEELYDHENDPQEWKNLTKEDGYQSVINQLKKWIPKENKQEVGKVD
ncbi:MAG: sulfatase [Saprospiraceae bacterium]|nr:sulfatase [Saprospiraceae bacterium]